MPRRNPKQWWDDRPATPAPAFWADAYPTTNGLQPYRISFVPSPRATRRIVWVRYGKEMESTFELAKKAALADYPKASGWLIESPQRENPRRTGVNVWKVGGEVQFPLQFIARDYERFKGMRGVIIAVRKSKHLAPSYQVRVENGETVWAQRCNLYPAKANPPRGRGPGHLAAYNAGARYAREYPQHHASRARNEAVLHADPQAFMDGWFDTWKPTRVSALSRRRNPPRDPKFRGVFIEPPAGASPGDTVVIPSKHKPGRWEALVFDGDTATGRYTEHWFFVSDHATKDAAEATARDLAR